MFESVPPGPPQGEDSREMSAVLGFLPRDEDSAGRGDGVTLENGAQGRVNFNSPAFPSLILWLSDMSAEGRETRGCLDQGPSQPTNEGQERHPVACPSPGRPRSRRTVSVPLGLVPFAPALSFIRRPGSPHPPAAAHIWDSARGRAGCQSSPFLLRRNPATPARASLPAMGGGSAVRGSLP